MIRSRGRHAPVALPRERWKDRRLLRSGSRAEALELEFRVDLKVTFVLD